MTPTEVKEICEKYHVRPSKALGQNFLVDNNVVTNIIDAIGIERGDTVVEIGPGLGALTSELIKVGIDVIAIEKDKRLAQYLEDTYSNEKNFTLYNEDALRFDLEKRLPSKYVLVGNLPYSITSPLLAHFIEIEHAPTKAVIMIQKEVADRMLASPPNMNMLGLSMQMRGSIKKILTTSPQSFWPQPEIDSTVIRWDPIEHNIAQTKDIEKIAKAAFQHKRKQLFSTVTKAGLANKEMFEKALLASSLSKTIRPQELSVGDWQNIVVYLSQ